MQDFLRSAADHAVIEGGMAARADNDQVRLEIASELDDVAHGVSGQKMSAQSNMALLGKSACSLQCLIKP